MAEDLRRGRFSSCHLADSIPGFGGLGPHELRAPNCSLVVYLTNPEEQTERARAVLEPALTRGGRCAGDFRVEKTSSTWREVQDLSIQVISRLMSWDLSYREIHIARDSILIYAKNERMMRVIRDSLDRYASFPQDRVVVTLLPGPQELDGPIIPPAAAYLAVLDEIAIRMRVKAAGPPVSVYISDLPVEIDPSEVRMRGFEPAQPAHRCGTWIEFFEPVQFEDGSYRIRTVEGSSGYDYEVVCESGACRVVDSGGNGDDYVTFCPGIPPD
jgi:hypothetical protein